MTPPGRTIVALAALLAPLAPAAEAAQAPLPSPHELAICKRLIDDGYPQAARARLEPIVARHPKWAKARALLGLTYYKENRFEQARTHFAEALETDPGEIAVRPYYGWALHSLGEVAAARDMFASLTERLPDYAPGWYGLGVAQLDLDEAEAARGSFERTIDLAREQDDPPMEGRARARLGDLHLRLEDLEAARRELELAVELFPDEVEAHHALSRVLQRLGDAEGARAARERFEEAKARVRPESAGPPERP